MQYAVVVDIFQLMHHYISIHATHFVLIAATSNSTFCIWNGLWGLGIVATKHCRQDKLCKFNNASKRRMAEMVKSTLLIYILPPFLFLFFLFNFFLYMNIIPWSTFMCFGRCRTCGGSGLGYCNRCLGTGEYRDVMGFHFMKVNTNSTPCQKRDEVTQ